MGTVQDGHVNEVEHEYIDVSGGRNENDRRRRSHSVAIISNTGRGLAVSRSGAFGPLNTRSLTDVRQRARELTPPARKGKFQTDSKPNNKHHKMYKQFAKPPGQTPGEYSRDYPRATTVDGDDRRYGKLRAPVGDGLFAAYDPLDMKAAEYSDSGEFGLSLHAPFSLLARRDFLDGA